MLLTTTTSRDGEVAKILITATSKWGLGRKAQAASSIIRLWTGPNALSTI